MNGKMLSVFNYELRRNFTRKGYLFTTFGIPVVGFVIVMVLMAVSGSSDPEDQISQLENALEDIDQTGYVDYSGLFGQPSAVVADSLTAFASEDVAQAALDADEIDAYYIIPEDYLDTGNVTMIVPEFNPGQILSIEAPISNLVYGDLIDRDVDPALLLRVINMPMVERIQLEADAADGEDGVRRDEQQEFWIVYAFGMIFMISIFGTNGYLMQTVIEEKENKLVEILIASVRPMQLLVGKILGLGLVGLFQVVVWVMAALVLSQVASSSSGLADSFLADLSVDVAILPVLVIYFILGYLFMAAGFGAIGAISNSMREGPNYSIILTIPAVVPFFFLTQFVEDPNGTLAVALSIFPVTAPIAMLIRLVSTDVPLIEVVVSLVLLVLALGGMMWLAGRIFRVGMLLSGTVPKPQELPRLIFGRG
jgi:ABC-2 type transport system permease protein